MDNKLKYFFWNGLKIINSMIANGTIEETKLSAELQTKINSGGDGPDIQYSTTERKIGSYFGEDLYEKSFNITADDYDVSVAGYTIDLGETADKIVDCNGFIYSVNENDAPYKLKLPINVEPSRVLGVDRRTNAIYTAIYDRAIVESDIYNATVMIMTEATDYVSSTGVIKVQYTKLSSN